MRVCELVQILEDYDDQLEVEIYAQPTWPLRHCLVGVTTRLECREADAGDEPEYTNLSDEEEQARLDKYGPNSLVLVASDSSPDGSPYGEKCAWEMARRR